MWSNGSRHCTMDVEITIHDGGGLASREEARLREEGGRKSWCGWWWCWWCCWWWCCCWLRFMLGRWELWGLIILDLGLECSCGGDGDWEKWRDNQYWIGVWMLDWKWNLDCFWLDLDHYLYDYEFVLTLAFTLIIIIISSGLYLYDYNHQSGPYFTYL